MIINPQNQFAALFVLLLTSLPITANAKNEACAGITQKCTKDNTYDKTIDGKAYSCYNCKQTLCKDGGNGGIAGTATTSVCTEKATTFQPISTDDHVNAADTLAPKPAALKRPGNAMDPRSNIGTAPDNVPARKTRPANFDEADALFGRRTRLQSEADRLDASSTRSGGQATVRDHRDHSGRANTIVKATRKARSTQRLQAPSELRIPSGSRTTLTILWRDNSTDEYGVELYRSDPVEGRRDPANAWKYVGTFQERVADRVTGTGTRRDVDDGLSPDTVYCYRMRAYFGFDRAQVSDFSDVACASTSM